MSVSPGARSSVPGVLPRGDQRGLRLALGFSALIHAGLLFVPAAFVAGDFGGMSTRKPGTVSFVLTPYEESGDAEKSPTLEEPEAPDVSGASTRSTAAPTGTVSDPAILEDPPAIESMAAAEPENPADRIDPVGTSGPRDTVSPGDESVAAPVLDPAAIGGVSAGNPGGGAGAGESAYRPPRLLVGALPLSAEESRALDAPEEIHVRLRVGTDGRVDRVEALDPGLSQELLEALRLSAEAMRFVPARRGGKPMEAWFSMTFVWRE